MREKTMAVAEVLALVLLITMIAVFSIKDAKSQKEIEDYQHQLIAVCGAISEARLEFIGEVFVYSEKFRKGVISFSTVEDQKDFVFTRRYNISPNGDLAIYKDNSYKNNSREEWVIKKTWEDYPEFASIGKK